MKKDKVYCLWGSCNKFESDCGNDCIVVGKPVYTWTLEEAKKQYPKYKFCEEWKGD